MAKKVTIKWKAVEVEVGKIKPTPENFKLKTDEGAARFTTSVDNYGLAGSVVINTDFVLIDGNTRLEKAKELGHKKIWASIPDRKLTPKEFKEFAAMYDFARAGEVDMMRITEELGTTQSFFDRWGMDMPEVALKKLKEMEQNENSITKRAPTTAPGKEAIQLRPVSLLFTPDQATQYIEVGESMFGRFKVDNITDLSMKILLHVKKNK